MKHDRDDCEMVHDDSLVPQQQAQQPLEGIVEAPCYYPTAEQFEEPLRYIASIRDEAERYGVCRICPPSGWKPPFAHKPDKLRFATKEQDLVSFVLCACNVTRILVMVMSTCGLSCLSPQVRFHCCRSPESLKMPVQQLIICLTSLYYTIPSIHVAVAAHFR